MKIIRKLWNGTIWIIRAEVNGLAREYAARTMDQADALILRDMQREGINGVLLA